MLFQKPPLASLLNESDVEQKLLYPLMIGAAPAGLSYDPADVHTKANIRKFAIGKGPELKSYFPDYIVSRGGLPLLIGEAKTPDANLDEAYREARLYATELNALFEPGIRPVGKIIVTNGKEIHAGVPIKLRRTSESRMRRYMSMTQILRPSCASSTLRH